MSQVDLPFATIWVILRKVLKWKAYRAAAVQLLSPAKEEARLLACQWFITHEEDWVERVIWGDEKWFVLYTPPNKQTDRYWRAVNPHELV